MLIDHISSLNCKSFTVLVAVFFSVFAGIACGDEKLSPAFHADKAHEDELDILKDYDRDIWTGPDGWTEEQWRWKRLLRWSKDCDYVGEVTVYSLKEGRQLVQVMCVPGWYQGKYYLYLFDPHDRTSTKLKLGLKGSSENQYDVWGNITFDPASHHIEILTLSRGMGDCGVYRVLEPNAKYSGVRLIEKRQKQCRPLPDNPDENIFDYKKWPVSE